MYNWNTLNQKAFKRLGFVVARSECEAVCVCRPGAVERVLKLVKLQLAAATAAARQADRSSRWRACLCFQLPAAVAVLP